MKVYILIEGFVSACRPALDEETIVGVFASSEAAKAAVRRENANVAFEEYSYDDGEEYMRTQNYEEGDDELYYIIREEEVKP